jgi:hypothetical protein
MYGGSGQGYDQGAGGVGVGTGGGGVGGTYGGDSGTYGQGQTYPSVATDSSGYGTGVAATNKPGIGDKVKGQAEVLIGKVTKNENLVEKGEERKVCPHLFCVSHLWMLNDWVLGRLRQLLIPFHFS